MTTFLALISLTLSAIGAVTLLRSVIRGLRGRGSQPWRDTAILVLMGFALWPAYLLSPVATIWLLYLCLPAALAAALHILFSSDASVTESGDGPERRNPAVALRVPHHDPREPDDEEQIQEPVVGGRRIA